MALRSRRAISRKSVGSSCPAWQRRIISCRRRSRAHACIGSAPPGLLRLDQRRPLPRAPGSEALVGHLTTLQATRRIVAPAIVETPGFWHGPLGLVWVILESGPLGAPNTRSEGDGDGGRNGDGTGDGIARRQAADGRAAWP